MACRVRVDTKLCKGCGICVSTCPRKALSLSSSVGESGYPYPIMSGDCVGCRLCEMFCPDFAIEVVCEGGK